MIRIPLSLFLSTLTIVSLGCRSGEPAPPDPAAESTPPPSSNEVTYEPAYPTDVSSEGLGEEDVAQQQSGAQPVHSHGGDEHSHEDDETADHDHEP